MLRIILNHSNLKKVNYLVFYCTHQHSNIRHSNVDILRMTDRLFWNEPCNNLRRVSHHSKVFIQFKVGICTQLSVNNVLNGLNETLTATLSKKILLNSRFQITSLSTSLIMNQNYISTPSQYLWHSIIINFFTRTNHLRLLLIKMVT